MASSNNEHEHSPLNDLAAGVTRTVTRIMAAYPRVKIFRPKLKSTHYDKFCHHDHDHGTAPPNRKSRLLPYAVNMVSGVALFSVYELGKPKGVWESAKWGMLGGMVHGAIMHPLEVMMMQGLRTWSHLPQRMWSLSPAIVKSSPLTIARDAVGFGLFFGVYEAVREHSGYTGVLATAGAGVAGAAAHHLVTFPAYAVRDALGPTAMHSSPREICATISHHRRTLFKGWGRSLLRAVPEGALTFVVYEAALSPKETRDSVVRTVESTRQYCSDCFSRS